MSNALAPKLGADIGFEQAVSTPSVASGLAGLATGLIQSAKPSESEKKGAALRPFTKRLDDLRNSNLTDQQFLREARKLGRTWQVDYPQYGSDINSAMENYGVTGPAEIVDVKDQYTQGLTEWSETTLGQYAIMQSTVVDSNGQVDMEATMNNYEVKYQENLAERAAVENTALEMEQVQGDENLWKAKSSSKMETFIPKWTTKSSELVTSLLGMVSSGDEQVDTFEEQMGFLRQQRRTLANAYVLEAQAAGLHSSTYKGEGASNIAVALAPIDDLIKMGENMASDPAKAMSAFKNMHEANALEQGIAVFGSKFILPEFQRALMGVVAGSAYADSEKTTAYLQGIGAQEKVGSLSLANGRITVEHARTNLINEEADGNVTSTEVTEAATETLADPSLQTADPRDAAVVADHQYRMLRVVNKPLGASVLNQVYNPTAVRNVAAIVKSGSEEAASTRQSYIDFAAEQVQFNAKIIEDELGALHQDVDRKVQFRNGELVLVEGHTAMPLDSSRLSKAIRNINTINTNSATILGLESKEPTYVLPRQGGEAELDEVKKYLQGLELEGSQGSDTLGQGVDTIQGNQGGDTLMAPAGGLSSAMLRESEGFREKAYWDVNAWRTGYGSDTVTRADGTIEKVTENTVVTREDAERDLDRREQEFAEAARTKVGPELWDTFGENVTAPLTNIAYNYGSLPPRIMKAVRSGDTEAIATAIEGLAGDNNGVNRSRRMREAAIVRGEALPPRGRGPVYSKRPKAAGEDTGVRDTVVTASPRPVARPQGTGESLSGELEVASGGEGTQRAPRRSPEEAQKLLATISTEQQAFLDRVLGNRDLVLRAIQDGTITLEDLKGA